MKTQIKDAIVLAGTRNEATATLYRSTSAPNFVFSAVTGAAKGVYQESLVEGNETWSGAGLKGEARRWAGQYDRSRSTLLRRIQRRLRRDGWDAGVPLVFDAEAKRWKRQLVVKSSGGRLYLWI